MECSPIAKSSEGQRTEWKDMVRFNITLGDAIHPGRRLDAGGA